MMKENNNYVHHHRETDHSRDQGHDHGRGQDRELIIDE